MEIVIEVSLCINIFLNSFILLISGKLLKERARLWFLSATIGGVVAILSPLFLLSSFSKLILWLASVAIACVISFPCKTFKKFILSLSVVFLVTFLFGGGVYAAENLIGSLSIFGVLLCAFVIYLFATMLLKHLARRRLVESFTYPVVLKSNGMKVEEEGFLDSGNMLYDSITGKPVMLVTYEIFRQFYQDISYISIITKSFDEKKLKNGHYIRVNSLSCPSNLLVFSLDEVEIGEESFKNVMVGLSLNGFDKCFGKRVLLHSEFVTNGVT